MPPAYKLRPAAAEDAEAIITWFPTRESAVLWGGPEVPDLPRGDGKAVYFFDPDRHLLEIRHY